MILYLDTSALAKAYVEEDFSAEIKAVLAKASIAATHQITFVEFHAALARAFREGRIREEQQKIAMQEFVRDWPDFLLGVESKHEIRPPFPVEYPMRSGGLPFELPSDADKGRKDALSF